MSLLPIVEDESIVYPETDGEPIAENTVQYEWIVTIHGNIDWLFRDDPNVAVFADLFWYPVRGEPAIRTAPDTMVVFGRPKGPRSSYLQWREGNVPPQVVFEVQSPGNSEEELRRRFDFFQHHGVEEYYLWYPQEGTLSGWRRSGDELLPIDPMHGHISPRLGVRFHWTSGELTLYHPNGEPFRTNAEIRALREQAERDREQADRAREQAERDREQADRARQQVEQERDEAAETARAAQDRADRLAARLRELGIDPDA